MNRGRRVAAGFAVFVLAIVVGDPGGAASSVESGWWSGAPVAAAPDISDDQLLLQGGASAEQPLAYAGVSFTLDADEAPEAVMLTVAPGSASTPGAAVAVCRLGAPATPAKGDPVADGPPIDCSTRVEAPPAGDGASYEVDVTTFAATGSLDIAVLPTRPADRIVLERPGADALRSGSGGSGAGGVTVSGSDSSGTTSETSSSSDSTAASGTFSGSGTSSPSGTSGSTSTAGSSFDFGSTPAPAVSTPAGGGSTAAAAPAAGGGAGGASSAANTSTAAAAAPGSSGGGSSSRAPFVFVGLALAAAALWALAGQHNPQPTVDAGDPA